MDRQRSYAPEAPRGSGEPQTDRAIKGKQKLLVAFVFLFVTALFALLLLRLTVFLPKQKLNRAMELFDSGDFPAAYAALKELGESGNVKKARYARAEEKIASGDDRTAFALLNGLDYLDSAEKADACLFRAQTAELSHAEVGSTVRFGVYEQDAVRSDGKEEIEWLVLDRDGSRALLISKYALDMRAFLNEDDENTGYFVSTWERSEIRPWLNGYFMNAALGEAHRKLIVPTVVTADPNPDFATDPGKDTKDGVFLLSVAEANRYFASDKARKCFGTELVYRLGAEKGPDGACWWWLRTPGIDFYTLAVVTANGAVFTNGFSSGHEPNLTVRPAMWIDLGGN